MWNKTITLSTVQKFLFSNIQNSNQIQKTFNLIFGLTFFFLASSSDGHEEGFEEGQMRGWLIIHHSFLYYSYIYLSASRTNRPFFGTIMFKIWFCFGCDVWKNQIKKSQGRRLFKCIRLGSSNRSQYLWRWKVAESGWNDARRIWGTTHPSNSVGIGGRFNIIWMLIWIVLFELKKQTDMRLKNTTFVLQVLYCYT